MKIKLKFKEGQTGGATEGFLTETEISFLVQYAVNSLMGNGVLFNLQQEVKSEEEVRIQYPDGVTLQ